MMINHQAFSVRRANKNNTTGIDVLQLLVQLYPSLIDWNCTICAIYTIREVSV